VPAALACGAILPSVAGAATPVPAPAGERVAAVEATVADAVAPVRGTSDDVAETALPASSGATRPGDGSDAHPVADTIAPIAHAATAPVEPSAPTQAPRKRLDEHARPGISHVGATSSAERMSSGRAARGRGLHRAAPSPSSERSTPAHRASRALPGAPAAPHAAARPGMPDPLPAANAPRAAASGGSGGFFFGGGGLALIVASLLLAGPGLRRQLAELPAVCRPAAFLVVLERPG
jgi:hypothetical protein